MKNINLITNLILLLIFIGILVLILKRGVTARDLDQIVWSEGDAKLIKIVDGDVTCYFSKWRIIEAISCVK